MAIHENRTELERLLADVWDYEDGARRKSSLPKWLFAATLTGAVLCTPSSSVVVAPVTTTLAPAPENTQVDKASPENLDEDLDYRVARLTNSLVGWRAFLEAHPDGPHAEAARAEVDRPPSTPPQPAETAEQSPPSAETTVVAENEPAPPPPPVEAAEQSPPSAAATQTPVEAAQPAAPAVAESEPAPPAIPAVAPDTIVASAPLPPSRPREVPAARSEEPAHHRHWRAEHLQAGQPNVFTILVAQLFHHHR